jgi:hypothetical protein
MIHILYRHTSNPTGITKNRPKWFSFESSLNNILNSINNDDNVTFHLLYDGECNIVDSRIKHTVSFKGGSDWISYLYAWNYAKDLDIKDNDLIYLAENDYIFVQGWSYKVQELFNTYEDLDYVTLYDHEDKYNNQIYPNLSTYLYITKNHHWRIVPNTTGSIIFNKKILNEDFDIHTSNPSDFGRFEFLRNKRNRNVLSPIPSLATHCEIEHLAPVINWEKIIQNDRII